MKKVCLLILFMLFLFGGCVEYSNEKAKHFIAGTYVVDSYDEFATTYDTLIIARQRENEIFQIKQTMLSKFFNKNKMPVYRVHHWTASYDAANKCLLIHNNGRRLFFYPERNELKSGTIIFKKL